MPGDTAKLYAQIAQDEDVYEKTRLNEEKQRKHMEAFVERFKAKASKAAAAQSRIKMLDKLPKLEALAKIADLDFEFQYAAIEAKRLMDVKSLQFGYDPSMPLIRKLDMAIQRGDRIAVIGKNGRGKSTLIKLLGGELTPQQGTISSHLQTKVGYFGQTNIDTLVDGMTVEEEVSSANPLLNRTAVRSICGSMMFGGNWRKRRSVSSLAARRAG
jgi:ATP-binding cassette subfamily F protein 3